MASITGASLSFVLADDYKPACGIKFILFTCPNDPGRFTNPQLIRENDQYFVLTYEEEAISGNFNVVLTAVAPVFRLQINSAGR